MNIIICYLMSICLFCSLHDFLPKEYVKVKGIEKKIFMVSFLPCFVVLAFLILSYSSALGDFCNFV